jgi:hypothetical protein
MTMPHGTRLTRDPWLAPDGPDPYEWLSARLAACGRPPVGPASSDDEIKEAFFDLMAAALADQDARGAWDTLRQIDRRLVVDFFFYEVPDAGLTDVVRELAGLEAPSLPAGPVRTADDAQVPPAVGDRPAGGGAGPPRLDLGELTVDWLRVLEDNDV